MENKITINNLEHLEEKRKNIIKKRKIIIITIAIIAIITIIIVRNFSIFFFFIPLTLVLIELLTHNDFNIFKKAYKQLIIYEIFKKHFDNINFYPDYGLNYNVFETIDAIKRPDRYSTNDYISATYKNISFEAADVHFEEKYKDSDRNSHYSTMFIGQWYIFDFNKSFVSDVQIIDKDFNYSSRNRFFQKNFNSIQLEDIDFNNLFNTYAKNDIDAFYLITPHLSEKIKNLKKTLNHELIFCFNNNKLHIGVNNGRNSFEPKLTKPINVNEIENKTLSEIHDIILFIDYLDLDNTLFRKEI